MNNRKSILVRYLIPLAVSLNLLIAVSSTTIDPSAQARSANSTVTVSPGSKIEVAVATWFDWESAQDNFDAVQMAIDDYGSIRGFDLQRNDYDAGCDPIAGAAAAAAITSNAQNVGVVGPFCSASTQAALPVFESADFVMISPSNTVPGLYTFGPNAFNRLVVVDPNFEAFDDKVSALATAQAWEGNFDAAIGHSPGVFAKYFYDAATLLLTRIEEVSTLDGGGNLVIDREELRTALRTTRVFPAVTGPVTLDAFGTRIDFFSQVIWDDEFNVPQLNDSWSWINEDPAHWSLAANPGFMQITTQSPGMNFLVQMTPHKDFVIRTRLLFTPVDNFQFANLTVFNNTDNKLTFGRAYCDTAPPLCVGNGIYFDNVVNGVRVGDNYATSVSAAGEAYLRLERDGSTYTGYFSENGTEWLEIGSHTISFTPTYIGLSADGQTSTTSTPADFDFFILEYDKYRQFLPLAQNSSTP